MSETGKEWFKDAQLGMFYHCGLYTLLGGNENGVRKTMSKAEYRELMKQFALENFDADAWVDCAKSMGAKFVMPTSRHAEGFCLWDSKLTDYKVTNTPCGRDLIAELADACARKDMAFSVYFNFETWMNEGDDLWNRDGLSYLDYMKGQLTELLTNYGPIHIVWFDHGHPDLTAERMLEIIDHIKYIQPDCLVNNRSKVPTFAGKHDYISAERVIPVRRVENQDIIIESCDSMGVKSWGYHNEEAFWSTSELAKRVSRCAANDYVYLLNVEPAPDGTIRPECVSRAQELGEWVRLNSDALKAGHSTFAPIDPNQQHHPEIGVATVAGKTVYLHLHEWPIADEVLVYCQGTPKSAFLTGAAEKSLAVSSVESGVLVRGLPATAPSGPSPWIMTMTFADEPVAMSAPEQCYTLAPAPGEAVFLAPQNAQLDGPAEYGGVWPHLNHFPDGRISVGLLHRDGDSLTWQVTVSEDTEYQVFASFGTVKDQANGEFEMTCGNSKFTGGTWMTEHYSKPVSRPIGKLHLTVGENTVVFKITKSNFSDIHGFTLVPMV